MLVKYLVLYFFCILSLSLLAKPISKVLHLPYASILVVLGFITSELVVFAGIDTGLRFDNFQTIVFHVLLPILIFESAFNFDKVVLKKNLIVILSLAIVAMSLTCLIVSVLLFYGINHEAGFPWIAALLTGAVLAAADPVAIIATLKAMKVPKRITVLLDGESLFSDAMAIVLFGLFLSMAITLDAGNRFDYSTLSMSFRFVTVFVGGAVIGLLVGLCFGMLQKYIQNFFLTAVINLFVAYGSYHLAEYFMVSGVISTLLAALSYSFLMQNLEEKKRLSRHCPTRILNSKKFLAQLAHYASVSVFLVMGAVITSDMFEERWWAMLIAMASLFIARLISVYGVMQIFSLFKKEEALFASQTVMVWGGLRGAVTLALALSLPTTLEYWWTIQSIAFGVVMFSLFVQAPTMPSLVRLLSLNDKK